MPDESAAHRPVIIVGGGAAGAAAALAVAGRGALMLDVGETPAPCPLPQQPLPDLRSGAVTVADVRMLDDTLLGKEFESVLRPHEQDLSIKLKPPGTRFIVKRPPGLPVDEQAGFYGAQSFALGGLANAWGAGAMRYTDRELRHFPFPRSELDEGFDVLTRHMGISGSQDDDLAGYFGPTTDLLPELPLCDLADRFLQCYTRRKSVFQKLGIRVGRPRLAVLPVDHGGRRAFHAFGQEYFVAPHEGIYSPSFTIQQLVRGGTLEYRGGFLIERFSCLPDVVRLFGREVATGRPVSWSADHVVLAAGTLNSSRIVLASREDTSTRLPLLDNPVSLLPFVDLGRIGVPLRVRSFGGAELSVVVDGDGESLPTQGSIYNLLGPLHTDVLREYPLGFSGNLAAGRYVTPATLVLQLFQPDFPRAGNHLQLLSTGGLRLVYEAVSTTTA